MGLTIHYSLHAETPSAADARHLVEQLHQAAMDLPFAEVGDVVELADDSLRFEDVEDDEVKWLLVQATHWLQSETGFVQVRPSHVIAFVSWPVPDARLQVLGCAVIPPRSSSAARWSPRTSKDGIGNRSARRSTPRIRRTAELRTSCDAISRSSSCSTMRGA